MDLDTMEFKRIYDRVRKRQQRLRDKRKQGVMLTPEQNDYTLTSPLVLARQEHERKKHIDSVKQKDLSVWQRALEKQKIIDLGYEYSRPLEHDRPSPKIKTYDLLQLPDGDIIPVERKHKKEKQKGIALGYNEIV